VLIVLKNENALEVRSEHEPGRVAGELLRSTWKGKFRGALQHGWLAWLWKGCWWGNTKSKFSSILIKPRVMGLGRSDLEG
jgi:hypothetical protein